MAFARTMTCSLCQLDGLCAQVHQKVSTDIEHIETELVSSLSPSVVCQPKCLLSILILEPKSQL